MEEEEVVLDEIVSEYDQIGAFGYQGQRPSPSTRPKSPGGGKNYRSPAVGDN